MTTTTVQVGNVRIDAIYDMNFDVDKDRIFPSVEAEAWTGLDSFVTDEDKVRLTIVCYLIRSGGRVILCDTGLGTIPGTESPGELLEGLAAVGVQPEDIDTIVFTHLHRDHVGWNVQWENGTPELVFPNARHLIHRAEWSHSTAPERRENPAVQQQLLPLEALGALDLLDEAITALTPEVDVIATFGHTPGHMSIDVHSDGEHAFVQGDVVVHHVLLARPEWEPRFDFEPKGARTLRERELDRWAEEHLLIAANHFPWPGFGYIEKAEAGWSWRPLD